MPHRPKAVAFDVDADSLASIRHAFPDWDVEVVNGATTGSLARDWNPHSAALLIVGSRSSVAETLGLCRGLRSQLGRSQTPLLVLIPPAQEALARAALEAGAHSCLVLPVHPKHLIAMMDRAEAGNQPGKHTLGSDRAQHEDSWRDDGGEA